MKKVKLLPLLCIVPCISSCNGFYVSQGEGIIRLNDISESLEEKPNEYSKFTYTHNTLLGDTKTEIKVICDLNAKFYYSYRITSYESTEYKLTTIDEYWRYKKDNNLYICYRENGAMQDGRPIVTIVTNEYSDENWLNIEEEILRGNPLVDYKTNDDRTINPINYGIDKTLNENIFYMKMVGLFGEGDVQFSSWNKMSVTLEFTKDEESYRCDVVDKRLTWLYHKVEGGVREEEFNISYEYAHITYLDF